MTRTILIIALSFMMLGAMCNRRDEFESTSNVLRGVVTDRENHDPLIGVSIQIDSTEITTLTDLDGRYWIRNIAPGEYHVKLRSIGYQPVDTIIAIIAGIPMRCDFALTLMFPPDQHREYVPKAPR